MSDETKVIAQSGDYRVLADGVLESFHFEWYPQSDMAKDAKLIAALLADAVRRVTDRVEAVEHDAQENAADHAELGNRIESVSSRINGLGRRVTELDGWHPCYPDEKPLADRVSVLEQEAVATRENEVSIMGRLSALEARQQDEAITENRGEPPPTWNLGNLCRDRCASAHDSGYSLGYDEGMESGRHGGHEQGKRELAREITIGLRCGAATSAGVRAALRSQEICADWIQREYGQPDGGE